MATWSSSLYANNTPPGGGHGPYQNSQHMHATVLLGAAAATNDMINFGYIPAGAIVIGVVLKAQSQLDSGGSPSLTFDVGISGTPQLWKAAITTVGRANSVSSDSTIATAGGLYKNTSGNKQLVIGTVHAGAATAVAGNLELDVAYYVEDTPGSPA
jgi:hypothetical protein